MPPLRSVVWILIALAVPSAVVAQTAPDSVDAATAVEQLVERTDPETTTDELIEWLSERAVHPLDVNTAPPDQLARLPGISLLVAQRIVAARSEMGSFANLDAVQKAAGLDTYTFSALRPFLTTSRVASSAETRRLSFGSLEGQVIQRMTRRLDVGRGFDPDTTRTTYAGSPERWYTRIQLRTERQLRLNLTLEKDPGEAFQWAPGTQTYGFDHVSAHAMLHDLGPIESLIIGDYTVSFGQGVGLWDSFSFSKGRDVIGPVARHAHGLSPFSSTEENRFFRGAAATVDIHPAISASGFVSRRTLDATTTLDAVGDRVPQSRTESGLHRTPTERANKDVLREAVVGGAIQWQRGGAHLGVSGYRSATDRPLAPPPEAYRRFDPTGRYHHSVSVFGSIVWEDLHAFGEWTRAPGAWGGTGGIQVEKSIADAALSIRHFPADFASLYGRAFAERGDPPQNETGVYLAARIRPARHWQLSAYVDQYRFPWLRFATPRPSAGFDSRLVIEHTPRPWLSYYLQAQHEQQDEGVTVGTAPAVRSVHPATRQSLRLHAEYAFSERLTFRMRVEGVRSHRTGGRSSGTLLYQGARWRPTMWLRLDTRWALFDTGDFAARIYAYEHDLLYAFSIPVFNGQGTRHHLLAQFAPSERMRLELKYASTAYRDVDTVGSGLDEVSGDRVREVRAQIRWRF